MLELISPRQFATSLVALIGTLTPASAAQTTWPSSAGGNDHAYMLVRTALSWTDARAAAQAASFGGQPGYLATITSAAENAFLVQALGTAELATAWVGASDSAAEGDWRWVVGPEAGTQFWSGSTGMATPPFSYADWGANEPNNSGGEHYACWSLGTWGPTLLAGQWVDANDVGTNASIVGYIVEFDAPTPSVAAGPRDVVLVDVDGDGDLDAATANADSDDVFIFANDGAGGFGVPSPIALSAADDEPRAIAAGDLDGDGAADDLVVTCAESSTVAVILDAGSVAPGVSSLPTGGTRPVSVAVGDLDGDGRDDVVVGLEGALLSGGAGVEVRLGGAAFAAVALGGVADRAVAVEMCDLDGDGDFDVVAVSQGSPDQLLLLENDGAGALTLAGAIDLPTDGLASGVCCRDLDGDGAPDMVALLPVLFPTPANTLRVLLYTGAPPLDGLDFTAAADLAVPGTLAVDVACGEVDGDSLPGFFLLRDVAVVNAGSGDAWSLAGFDAGALAFARSAAVGVGTNPVAVAVGDVTGDGLDDIVVANQGSDDITVTAGMAVGAAQPFGVGCAGTGGLVPSLQGIGQPTVGNASFGVALDNARPLAPALVFVAADQATAALSGGCSYYLAPPSQGVLRFTDSAGRHDFVFGIPNVPALAGLDLFFQSGVFDANGAFAGVLAMSNGLRVVVGL